MDERASTLSRLHRSILWGAWFRCVDGLRVSVCEREWSSWNRCDNAPRRRRLRRRRYDVLLWMIAWTRCDIKQRTGISIKIPSFPVSRLHKYFYHDEYNVLQPISPLLAGGIRFSPRPCVCCTVWSQRVEPPLSLSSLFSNAKVKLRNPFKRRQREREREREREGFGHEDLWLPCQAEQEVDANAEIYGR